MPVCSLFSFAHSLFNTFNISFISFSYSLLLWVSPFFSVLSLSHSLFYIFIISFKLLSLSFTLLSNLPRLLTFMELLTVCRHTMEPIMLTISCRFDFIQCELYINWYSCGDKPTPLTKSFPSESPCLPQQMSQTDTIGFTLTPLHRLHFFPPYVLSSLILRHVSHS